MSKLHIPHPLYTTNGGPNTVVPLCKAFAAIEIAKTKEEVTCKNCLKVAKRIGRDTAKILKDKAKEQTLEI